jgi:integrase
MQSLFDNCGKRKYIVADERRRFLSAALDEGGRVGSFCATLALTGARISEVLALTPDRIDTAARAIVFETLKRRKRGIFRAVPVPRELLVLLEATHELSTSIADLGDRHARLWPWCRTTAWSYVKQTMNRAGIGDAFAKPKALRHGFAVEAGQNGVPLNMVQRWLGHARIETTAIYAAALGREERALAQRTWQGLRKSFKRSG